MSVDLSVLTNQLKEFAPFDRLPGVEYVDNYIKAFYLPEEYLLEWISEHPEYKRSHHIALVMQGCGATMKRKYRDEYMKKVEARIEQNELKKVGMKTFVDRSKTG